MDDIDISNEIFNLFKKSGYSVESMATDEDGTEHKIVCKSENRIIIIYTAVGKIVNVDSNELNDPPEQEGELICDHCGEKFIGYLEMYPTVCSVECEDEKRHFDSISQTI